MSTNVNNKKTEMDRIWSIIKLFNSQLKDEDLICVICKTILANAHQGPCGCKYCMDCITAHFIQQSKQCPGTKSECQDSRVPFVIDYELNRKLKNIEVKCLKNSCDFSDRLCNIETHMMKCYQKFEDCPFSSIGACDQTNISLDIMDNHLTSANFGHCKFLINYIHYLNGKFERLQETQVQEIKKLKSDFKKYLDKTFEETKLKITDLESEINNSREREQNINMGLQFLLQKLEESENKFNDFVSKQNPISGIRFLLEEYKELQISKEFAKDLRCVNLNNRVSELQSKIERENKFIWIVDNFKQKVDTAKSGQKENVYSSPFYSRKNGFKIQLRLTLNGYRNENSKYLSVFFGLLKGEFDSMINWPIRENIRIDIINQCTREFHKSQTFNYQSASENDQVIFHQPKSDDSPISFYGNYQFIELDEIHKNPFLILNDQIIFTCLVSND